MRVEREVVGDERRVRAEERLEPAPQAPVDDERLVAPEEPVVDEHHVGAHVGRLLEQRPRARDAADEQCHVVAADDLQPGRSELRPALHLEQGVRVGDDLVPAGHAHSLGAARSAADAHVVRERVPCGRSGCGAAW